MQLRTDPRTVTLAELLAAVGRGDVAAERRARVALRRLGLAVAATVDEPAADATGAFADLLAAIDGGDYRAARRHLRELRRRGLAVVSKIT